LAIAEFSYNNKRSSSTGFSPFYIEYGYNPHFTVGAPRSEKVPAAEDLSKHLKDIHTEAEAMLRIATERYKEQADKNRKEPPTFKVGDKVWLNRRNINTDRPTLKLDYRRLGPYEILEEIGPRAFRLKLPTSMKIHDVFHVSMLEPWVEDRHGRKPIPLPPVIVDGEEEYEVERVLNSRIKGKHTEYLVRWKGYSQGDDSWTKESDMGNAQDLIEEFYYNNPNAARYKAPPTRRR
jgi:hypothetical protein